MADVCHECHCDYERPGVFDPTSVALLLSRQHHQGVVRVLKHTLAFVNPNLAVALGHDGSDSLCDPLPLVRWKNGQVALTERTVDADLRRRGKVIRPFFFLGRVKVVVVGVCRESLTPETQTELGRALFVHFYAVA